MIVVPNEKKLAAIIKYSKSFRDAFIELSHNNMTVSRKIELENEVSEMADELRKIVTCEDCNHCAKTYFDGQWFCKKRRIVIFNITICDAYNFKPKPANHKPFQLF